MNIRNTATTLAAGLALTFSAAAFAGDYGNKGKDYGKNIVETAQAAGQFDTLVTAVKAAGLVETLSGEGPFTVFAPTDEAFAKIPQADLEALLANTDALTSVLTYHVIAGKVMAADVIGLSEAKTVQGSTIDISVDGSTVMIDGAKVVTTDIETANGVIHVIDSVITP